MYVDSFQKNANSTIYISFAQFFHIFHASCAEMLFYHPFAAEI